MASSRFLVRRANTVLLPVRESVLAHAWLLKAFVLDGRDNASGDLTLPRSHLSFRFSVLLCGSVRWNSPRLTLLGDQRPLALCPLAIPTNITRLAIWGWYIQPAHRTAHCWWNAASYSSVLLRRSGGSQTRASGGFALSESVGFVAVTDSGACNFVKLFRPKSEMVEYFRR